MKLFACWLPALAVLGVPASCLAQTGTVTFYSYTPSLGQAIKIGLIAPGSRGAFNGWLFDGDKKVMHASPGTFVTLRLTAGGHDLAAKYRGKPKKPDLHLDVENGRHYCVRLSVKIISPIVVAVAYVDTKVEEIPCQKAIEETSRYHPLDPNRIEPPQRGDVEPSLSFPKDN